MRKFKCKCGNNAFFLSENKAIAKCSNCFKEYEFIGGQWIKSPSRIKKVIGFFNPRKMSEYIYRDTSKPFREIREKEEETLGEFRKRLGIKKTKKEPMIKAKEPKIENRGPGFANRQYKAKLLFEKWKPLLKRLEAGKIYISENEHYGKLRGQSIAKKAKSELKQLGYELQVKYKNKGAVIWLKK